jgi:cytidylate kinase
VSRPRVVAIDGTAGAGKSTIARGVAERLDLPYVNTGEMYRALAASAAREGVETDDAAGLLALARRLRFRVADGEPPLLEVEGWPTAELHTHRVDLTVSAVSGHPQVREHLRGVQRELGQHGAVMEGRDIGSVVVPDAPVKIFVTASDHVRASRRADQRGSDRTLEIGDALRTRDARDAVTSPLEPAEGADVLDTSELSVEGSLQAAIDIVRRRAPELIP